MQYCTYCGDIVDVIYDSCPTCGKEDTLIPPNQMDDAQALRNLKEFIHSMDLSESDQEHIITFTQWLGDESPDKVDEKALVESVKKLLKASAAGEPITFTDALTIAVQAYDLISERNWLDASYKNCS